MSAWLSTATVAGIQLTSAIDYPDKLCTTIFVGGCNYRCPFCHNGSLVTEPRGAALALDNVLSALERRRGLVDAVTITGGEPTLQPDLLASLVRAAKGLGYLVKLDTNGSHPEVVADLLPWLDYVAVDVKHAPGKYEVAAGVKVDTQAVASTITLLAGHPHELRTTVVPGLHEPEDIRDIGEWVASLDAARHPDSTRERRYFIQSFRAGPRVLDPVFRTHPSFTREELQAFRAAARPYFAQVTVRGHDFSTLPPEETSQLIEPSPLYKKALSRSASCRS